MKRTIGKDKVSVKWGDDVIFRLKPCPFCGSTKLELSFHPSSEGLYPNIFCTECGATVRAITNSGKHKDSLNLVDLWNTRFEGGELV